MEIASRRGFHRGECRTYSRCGRARLVAHRPGAIVYVAYDARPEAERFACLVGRVLAGYGLAAMVSDRFAPTPALAWTVAHDNRACGGIMVTGSHNPYDYLGIKLYMDDGGIASAEFAEEIEASIEGEPSDVRGPIERRDIVLPYLDDLARLWMATPSPCTLHRGGRSALRLNSNLSSGRYGCLRHQCG